MSISEEARHRLYGRLEEVLGGEEASTLMQHLPPVGWGDVATRRDLQHLEDRLGAAWRADLAVVGREVAELRGALRSEVRGSVWSLLISLVVLQLTAAGLVVAVAQFL